MRVFLPLVALVCALGFNVAAEAKGWAGQDQNQNQSQEALPICLDRQQKPIEGNNNDQVLYWKTHSQNQYHDRALVSGVLVGVFLDRRSHLQLDVDLDPSTAGGALGDHIEIIYNKSFGQVGEFRPGDKVEACGDYITSTKQAGHYPPSPAGAILHWVHKSNNPGRHADGFLAIGGVVYGMEGDEGGHRAEYQGFAGFSGFWLAPRFQ
jgi:hypothetical protein